MTEPRCTCGHFKENHRRGIGECAIAVCDCPCYEAQIGCAPVMAGEAGSTLPSASAENTDLTSSCQPPHAQEIERQEMTIMEDTNPTAVAATSDLPTEHQLPHDEDHAEARLRAAFDAGWNATKWVVCNRDQEETARSLREQQDAAYAAFIGAPEETEPRLSIDEARENIMKVADKLTQIWDVSKANGWQQLGPAIDALIAAVRAER